MAAEPRKTAKNPADLNEAQHPSGLRAVPKPTFARVPTHAVGFPSERRIHARAALNLPLRLRRVGDVVEPVPVTLLTRNISSSGVFFLAPRSIAPGTPIELEVALVDRPLGQGSVRMCTAAHVIRTEPANTPGWHGVAATFDDIAFDRDDALPPFSHR